MIYFLAAVFVILFIAPVLILAEWFDEALLNPDGKKFLMFLLIVDVWANYTTLAFLFWSVPRRGEWTFSKHLPRLCTRDGWRGELARRCKIYINRKVPGHILDTLGGQNGI